MENENVYPSKIHFGSKKLGDGVNLLVDVVDLLGDGVDLLGDALLGGHQGRLLHRNVQGQWKFKSMTDGPSY